MICREATKEDLPRLVPFIKRELAAWGYKASITRERLVKALEGRWRYAFYADADGVQAALAIHPLQTVEGPAYDVRLFLVTKDHPDRLRIRDALTLYGCNVLRSEGIRIVLARSAMLTEILHGRDILGMQVVDEGYERPPPSLLQHGDTEAIIANILDRYPQWRLSL